MLSTCVLYSGAYEEPMTDRVCKGDDLSSTRSLGGYMTYAQEALIDCTDVDPLCSGCSASRRAPGTSEGSLPALSAQFKLRLP